jgi:hypothetical protein
MEIDQMDIDRMPDVIAGVFDRLLTPQPGEALPTHYAAKRRAGHDGERARGLTRAWAAWLEAVRIDPSLPEPAGKPLSRTGQR